MVVPDPDDPPLYQSHTRSSLSDADIPLGRLYHKIEGQRVHKIVATDQFPTHIYLWMDIEIQGGGKTNCWSRVANVAELPSSTPIPALPAGAVGVLAVLLGVLLRRATRAGVRTGA